MKNYSSYLKEISIYNNALTIMENEPMCRHTTMQVGGAADILIIPKNEEGLQRAIHTAKKMEIPYAVIGNGSNLLVRDEGYRGIVFCLVQGLNAIRVDGLTIEAGAGALLSQIAAAALKVSLTGMEFASGIPGSLGGALFMNAGAYGGQISDVVFKTRYLNTDGEIDTLSFDNHQFDYRRSAFKAHPDWIALSSEIKLQTGDYNAIKAKMDDLNGRRRDKQPLNFPSSGSTFKRPEGYFAGQLIEESGLKGFSIGGAQVSEKHAGFVINKGGATCDDVLRLIEHIQNTVMKKFNVALEPEVRVL